MTAQPTTEYPTATGGMKSSKSEKDLLLFSLSSWQNSAAVRVRDCREKFAFLSAF